MSGQTAISRLNALPPDLDELLKPSVREGFRLLERLRDDWRSGANCFALPGEALFEARRKGRLVGICGLNRDPYADDSSVGRVRRLYVAPDVRRSGVARQLVCAVLRESSGHFAALRVRTDTREADLFYEALGFSPLSSVPTASHEIQLSGQRPAV